MSDPVCLSPLFLKKGLTNSVHFYTINMYRKEGDILSPRTGRPPSKNPKDIQVKFLADKSTIEDLMLCCKKLGMTKSDVIRLGIQKVKELADKK